MQDNSLYSTYGAEVHSFMAEVYSLMGIVQNLLAELYIAFLGRDVQDSSEFSSRELHFN